MPSGAQDPARSDELGVPAAADLRAEHDERLRPAPRELRVCGVLAALSHSQCGSVDHKMI